MRNTSNGNNPLTDLVNYTVEVTRIDTGGNVATALAPAASKGRQAGTVSTSGDWEPYGRVEITPVDQFRVS